MKIVFLKKEGFTYKFLIQGTRYDFVNALRRTIISKVKTLAIENISIYKNESIMPDEFMAHRLGLIPVNSRDFDDKTEVKLFVQKESGMVRSGDMDVDGAVIKLKNIPITKLKEGKKLELEMKAVPGNGDDHIKWSPALVYYFNVPELVNVDKDATKKYNLEEMCPRKLLEVKAGKVFLKDIYSCDLCKYCEKSTEGAVIMNYKEDEFVFCIEPYGNLDIDLILKNSIDYLKDELNELKKQL
jgi:DNA-directed RNA polymerase subunit D